MYKHPPGPESTPRCTSQRSLDQTWPTNNGPSLRLMITVTKSICTSQSVLHALITLHQRPGATFRTPFRRWQQHQTQMVEIRTPRYTPAGPAHNNQSAHCDPDDTKSPENSLSVWEQCPSNNPADCFGIDADTRRGSYWKKGGGVRSQGGGGFHPWISSNNKATVSPEISRQQVKKLTPQFLFCIYWI